MIMRSAVLLLAMLLLPVVAKAQSGIVTLADLRDHARPLLIFAEKPDDPQLTIQLRTLAEHSAEAHDRQILAIAVVYNNPSPTDAQFIASEAGAARRRFSIAPGQFTVILIGKDGEEKLRATKPLSITKLNDTIDAMPMRRAEIKRGSR